MLFTIVTLIGSVGAGVLSALSIGSDEKKKDNKTEVNDIPQEDVEEKI